jgi:selenocysteine lyase/cysteine desulfurase
LAYFEGRPMPPTQASFVTPGGFVAYENLLAMEDAVALHDSIGRAAIAARIAELAGQMRRELARMRGVSLVTPLDPDLAAGIICFEVGGKKPEEVALRLRQRGVVATASPYAVSYARIAAGIMVQPADIERTLREIQAVST